MKRDLAGRHFEWTLRMPLDEHESRLVFVHYRVTGSNEHRFGYFRQNLGFVISPLCNDFTPEVVASLDKFRMQIFK